MKFPIGLRLNAKVNNITKLGLFVTLPHHHHGLIFIRILVINGKVLGTSTVLEMKSGQLLSIIIRESFRSH